VIGLDANSEKDFRKQYAGQCYNIKVGNKSFTSAENFQHLGKPSTSKSAFTKELRAE